MSKADLAAAPGACMCACDQAGDKSTNSRRFRRRSAAEKRQVKGAIAQLGERLPCTQEVGGSIPPGSTKFLSW